jgi:acyl carrier protein
MLQEIETFLTQELSQKLNRTITKEQSYFDIGGDSMISEFLFRKVEQEYDLLLSMDDLFTYPILSDLSNFIYTSISDSNK